MADAIAECLVKLALDDDFRQRFNDSSSDERMQLLEQHFPEIKAIPKGVVDALARKSTTEVAEHLFSNQQTSAANSNKITRAVRALVAAIDEEKGNQQ